MALSKQNQLQFAEHLLTLLEAGLPLLNAIALIQTTTPTTWLPWISSIHGQLKKGESFSQCLRAQKNLFSMEFINLIRVSERTGDFNLALKTICQQLEAQIELRRKIQQAMSYPIITLASSFLLVIVMMIWGWLSPIHWPLSMRVPDRLNARSMGLVNAPGMLHWKKLSWRSKPDVISFLLR